MVPIEAANIPSLETTGSQKNLKRPFEEVNEVDKSAASISSIEIPREAGKEKNANKKMSHPLLPKKRLEVAEGEEAKTDTAVDSDPRRSTSYTHAFQSKQ